MVFNKYDGVKISAIAAAVPAEIRRITDLKTEDNARMIEQFIKKTGITQIHKAEFEQTASDFSYSAAKMIEASGRYTPDEIGVLVDVTQHPDYRTPSTACVLQKRLGLSNSCIAFDINLGCSGFVYGLSVASALLRTSNAKKALLLVGDTLARGRKGYNDASKRETNTELLFGDASAAILLEKNDESIIETGLMTDGDGFKVLAVPYGAWKHPIGPELFPGDDIAVFNFTIKEVPSIIDEFLKTTQHAIDDYDAVILHQANMMIMKQIAKKIGVSMEKVPISLDRFGNTSGASVPLTIVDRYGSSSDEGVLKLLTSGYGVGLSWGVASFKISIKDILPITIGLDSFSDGYEDKNI